MYEQDVGWRNAAADEDFGSEVGQMWLVFVQTPTLLGLSMINMGQMILSKPSIIIIWTYQDMISLLVALQKE
jgi:hypothetical protein